MQIKELGTKIKDLRISRGYTLEYIADKIGITKQGYNLWEEGKREWDLEKLLLLSKILDFKVIISDGTIDIVSDLTLAKNYRGIIRIDTEFDIIKVYTQSKNVNLDLNHMHIIDNTKLYKTKQEAKSKIGGCELYGLYALYNKHQKCFYEDSVGFTANSVLSFYFSYFAPILDEDGTVYIDEVTGTRIVKQPISKYYSDNINKYSFSGKKLDYVFGILKDGESLDSLNIENIYTLVPAIIE